MVHNLDLQWCVAILTALSFVVAHFRAHRAAPVTQIAMDYSGMLIVTACSEGQEFHVFRLGLELGLYCSVVRIESTSCRLFFFFFASNLLLIIIIFVLGCSSHSIATGTGFGTDVDTKLGVQHLYTLNRGVTIATIDQIAFRYE